MDFMAKVFIDLDLTDILIIAFMTWWVYNIFTQKEKLDQIQKQVNANLQKVYQLNPKLMDAKWLKENTNNIKDLFPITEVNILNLQQNPQFLYKLKLLGFDFRSDDDLILILKFLEAKQIITFKNFLVKVRK